MRVTFISDLHDRFEELVLPDGHVLCVCGDATTQGSVGALKRFFWWLRNQPYQFKIFVPGNHDRILDTRNRDEQACQNARELRCFSYDCGVNLLIDQFWAVNGLMFYGTPWTRASSDRRAFKLDSEAKLAEKYAKIPSNVDVLLTHMPPAGLLDDDFGSTALFDRLFLDADPPRPRVHAFGHAHLSGGQSVEFGGVRFVNGAVLNRSGQFHPHPFVTLEL